MKTFIFFREEGWYPAYLQPGDQADILENVRLNPGTIRVEDIEGNVVWPVPKEKLT